MLSGLRPGNPVYVLYKNEPKVAVGKVAQVSNQYPPQLNFQQPLNPNNLGMMVDLSIEVDGKTEPFPRIPINSSVAEFPDRGVIISETRDGIVNEIGVIRNASQTALEQVDVHKRIIASCDRLLLDLNPQLKREQEQAGKIARLEEQLAGMSDQIAALTGMLSKSLGKKKED
ncbi:MAG: hypothetical protein IKH15_04860 [Bacteroidales bacterium]|nr:hypothetical protein [Bacteroidales bacterium]